MTLDPKAAAQLARICGMFGSKFEAERATAARMADANKSSEVTA